MSRNLLHRNRLPAFIAWLDRLGLERRADEKHGYCLLLVKHGKQWLGVYDRLGEPAHLSIDPRLESLVRRFIRESKGGHAPRVPRIVIRGGEYLVPRPHGHNLTPDEQMAWAAANVWCAARNQEHETLRRLRSGR
jgi:hypothetical protein